MWIHLQLFRDQNWICSVEFYVLLTVHLGIILVNDQLDAQLFFSYMFIPDLYMFRAHMCSSSEESIVLIWHLVYVTVCWWPSGMQVWVELNGVPILYMFRAPLYSSSGESIVLIHLVYVTVCWWPSGLQVWVELHGVPILYRFRAPLFSSSVESIALIHLVCVTLCRWQSGM